MSQIVLTLAPTGAPVGQSLGFTAGSVLVDNFTSSYLSLPDAGKTIPPWVYGAVVVLPPGIRTATAKLLATVPAVPGPPVPVSQCTLTWTDQILPAGSGHLLQQVTTQQQTVLGPPLNAAAGQTATKSFTIPAGTLAIGFAVNSGAALDTPVSVSITGDQTGVKYFLLSAATTTNGALSAALDTADTSVSVTLVANAAKSSQVDVLAWPVVAQVAIRQNPGDSPIGAVLQRSDGVDIDVDNSAVGQYELGVSLFRATPAAWQAPTTWAYAETQTTVSVDLVVPGVSQVVRIFAVYLTVDSGAGGFASVEDGTGSKRIVSLQSSSGTPVTAPWGGTSGFPLPAGHKVTLLPSLTASAVARASVAYSLA